MLNQGRLFLSFCLFVFSSISHAAGYVGLSYYQLSYEPYFASVEFEPTALAFKAGGEVNDVLAFEVKIGTGVRDDTVSDISFEIDNMFGLYGKFRLPNEKISPYLLFGFTRVEGTLSAAGYYDLEGDESDNSYGGGVDIFFSEKASLNLEYMNFLDKDGDNIEGFSLGFTLRLQ